MTDTSMTAAAPKEKLSIGAIVGIVLGALALVGIAIVAVLWAVGSSVFNSQQAQALDSAARADVSTLARDLAYYLVDNPPGSFTGSADGQNYTLVGEGGTIVVPQSDGVEFGGISVTSGSSWCIWVYAPNGDESKDGIKYTAARQLENGSC